MVSNFLRQMCTVGVLALMAAGALAVDRAEVDRLLDQATALEAQGAWLDALSKARAAERLAAEDPAVLRTTARLLVRGGATAQAMEVLSVLRRVAPREPAGYLLAALVLREEGRANEARGLLQSALDGEAGSPTLVGELAFLLVETGGYTEAEALVLERLSETDWARQAVIGLVAARDPARTGDAIERLSSVYRDGSGAPSPRPMKESSGRNVTTAGTQAGVSEGGRHQIALELARLLAESGKPAEAVSLLEPLSSLEGAPAEAFYRLAQAYRDLGRGSEAEQALSRFEAARSERDGLDRQAQEFGIGLNEAQDLARKNDVPGALEQVEKLLTRFPAKHPALALRAKLEFSMRRFPQALRTISEAVELAPGELEYLYLRGVFAAQVGELVLARESLEEALVVAPGFTEAARVLERVNELSAAEPPAE